MSRIFEVGHRFEFDDYPCDQNGNRLRSKTGTCTKADEKETVFTLDTGEEIFIPTKLLIEGRECSAEV